MKNSIKDKSSKNSHRLLIVEDNLFLADAIKMIIKILSQKESSLRFIVEQASDYESAVTKIKEARDIDVFDLIILDINLGKSGGGERKSGEEVGVLIRNYNSKAKIIVFTSYSDGLRIDSIIKNINPEGFLIKDGTTDHNMFQEVILKIIKGETYYCNTVAEILRKTRKITHKLDAIDIKLLYQLSIATRMKDIPKYIPLKLSGVEKRRRRLKETFNVESDRDLVLKAKEIGFL
ncbi:response regulator [Aureibaculum sp. 2210JD6-5]|uniref:response regulator n=1 Tax=Aureibaculum sp. 2210JD6-5 TaxID=3103957 RepID=UPI002AAD1BC5|nr:response regulator [Aureibaculum sp. 2210JD6-5]MDY7396329.1 response regulator [Aureibaculum sp. 2210JD6-5]